MKGGTTFSHTFEEVKSVSLPSLLLCHSELKSIAKEKYGYFANEEIVWDQGEAYTSFNKTPFELAEETNFILTRDFDISLNYGHGSSYKIKLGENEFNDGRKILVRDLWTSLGLCYLVEPHFERKENDFHWINLRSIMKENDSELLSYERKMDVFFASKNTYQGIFFYSTWTYLDVPKISIPFGRNKYTVVDLTHSHVQFRNGVVNVKKCVEDVFMKINCSNLCNSIIFNLIPELPQCETREEMLCILNNGIFDTQVESHFSKCLRPANAIVYQAKVIYSRSTKDSGVTWFKYSFGPAEVREEVLTLDPATFIGSIGGSLGLFLGFSCYTYITYFIDKIIAFVP